MHRLSLSATGHPGQRAGVLPGGDLLVDGIGGGFAASSAVTRLKAWISPSPDSMAASASSTTSRAERSPARTAAAISNAEAVTGLTVVTPDRSGCEPARRVTFCTQNGVGSDDGQLRVMALRQGWRVPEKRSSSVAGAAASTSARSTVAVTTSSRSTLRSG